MKRIIFLLLNFFIILCSCTNNEHVQQVLTHIDALCDSNPNIAMSMLDSIDFKALHGKDRYYYDLLSIKSKDKAYIRHISDSLILDVIDYYSSHKDESKYPEALYYGGRVYSDIGDLPTALEYFQKAIDAIPDDTPNPRFKRNVLNQTGRLLHALRLDSAAIEYFEKSISINEKIKDSGEGIPFAYVLLADSYLNIKDIKRARQNIDLAVKHSSNLSTPHRASILINLASILDQEGKPDSALSVIRPLPYVVDSLALSECLALASEIYMDAGILDTAYMYARKLTKKNSSSNKRTGYKVIFSEKLRNFVSHDTLVALIPEYKRTIEDYLNEHDGENAIIQNTRYNYKIHEKERLKAEKKLYLYMILASISVIISLSLLAIILYRKFKVAKTAASYATAVNLLKESTNLISERNRIIKNEIDTSSVKTISDSDEVKKCNNEGTCYYLETNDYKKRENLSEIKLRIMSGIKTADDRDLNSLVNPVIYVSPTYHFLEKKIQSKSLITLSEEMDVYKNLEELIESVSQGFIYRLQILTEGRVTPTESRIAMLIKCGFSPLQISILLGKEKNTISTHRRNLAYKITGEKKSDRSLDIIIISL